MNIFDRNNGKSTVEKDELGLTTGEIGGEYIQNRDCDGRPNGHITKEVDELGLRTGSLGGEYNQHHNKYGERVGYSFDAGHGRIVYENTEWDDWKEEPEKLCDNSNDHKDSFSSPSMSSSGSYGSGNSRYLDDYSYPSSSDFDFGPSPIIIGILAVGLICPQYIWIIEIILVLLVIAGGSIAVFYRSKEHC